MLSEYQSQLIVVRERIQQKGGLLSEVLAQKTLWLTLLAHFHMEQLLSWTHTMDHWIWRLHWRRWDTHSLWFVRLIAQQMYNMFYMWLVLTALHQLFTNRLHKKLKRGEWKSLVWKGKIMATTFYDRKKVNFLSNIAVCCLFPFTTNNYHCQTNTPLTKSQTQSVPKICNIYNYYMNSVDCANANRT